MDQSTPHVASGPVAGPIDAWFADRQPTTEGGCDVVDELVADVGGNADQHLCVRHLLIGVRTLSVEVERCSVVQYFVEKDRLRRVPPRSG